MGWDPKRYDPEPKKCPKCSWQEWETVAWLLVAAVALYVVIIVGSSYTSQ